MALAAALALDSDTVRWLTRPQASAQPLVVTEATDINSDMALAAALVWIIP